MLINQATLRKTLEQDGVDLMDNTATFRGRSANVSRITLQQSTMITTLFVIYVIGAHLRLSILSGGSMLVPMYLMLLSAATLTLYFINPLLRQAGATFAVFAVFILLLPIVTTAPQNGSGSTFLGSLQFMASIISALSMIYALKHLRQVRLRRLAITIWCVLILLSFLESIGLKPVFDQIRDVIYAGQGREIYLATERDLVTYGKIRSTAFATEPSFLADSLFCLAIIGFMLDAKRGQIRSWSLLLAMFVASFAVVPSFKALFYLLAVVIWQFWPRNIREFQKLGLGLGLLGALVTILFFPILNFFLNVVGGHLSSGSFYGRIASAHTVGYQALIQHPLMGFGLSNQEGVYPIIAQVWQASGAFITFPWYQEVSAKDLMSNGFWWQWIYLGLLGTVIFVFLLVRLLREIGVHRPLRSIVCSWIIWYAGSAFVDPQSWYIIVVFSVGAVAMRGSPETLSGGARTANG